MNNGKINMETGKFIATTVNAKTVSLNKMKIINIDNIIDASVKIAPLSKNSWNLDKYSSGTILSKTNAKSLIILNFMK